MSDWVDFVRRAMNDPEMEEYAVSHHKRYAPSAAEIWMNCAGALSLIDALELEGKADNSTNEYAEYGTVAHEIAAECLNEGRDAWEYMGEERESEGYVFEVDDEMTEIIQLYLDTVREDHRKFGGTLHVEKSAVLDNIDKECGGTSDAGFLGADDTARVYDFKSGFKYVDERWNKQLMIYLLQFLFKVLNPTQLKAAEDCELVIVQPRAFGHPPVRRFTLTRDDAINWMNQALSGAIKATKDPNAELVFGSWCTDHYCPARGWCPKAREKAAEFIEKAQLAKPVERLNEDEIGQLLELRKITSAYFKALEQRAFEYLMKNRPVPGQKLVKGIKHKVWKSGAVESVPEDLADEGFERKILSPAKFKKLGKKAAEFVSEWAETPPGSLTMAPADDKRPAEKAPEDNPEEAFSHLID